MYMYVHILIYIYLYIYTYKRLCVCARACMCVCICVCVCCCFFVVFVCTSRLSIFNMYQCPSTCARSCAYACTPINVHVRACTHTPATCNAWYKSTQTQKYMRVHSYKHPNSARACINIIYIFTLFTYPPNIVYVTVAFSSDKLLDLVALRGVLFRILSQDS